MKQTMGLDLDGMLQDLGAAPEGAVWVLHTVAHNPSGFFFPSLFLILFHCLLFPFSFFLFLCYCILLRATLLFFFLAVQHV